MAARHRSYVLTARAEADLRMARAWSRGRWGKELTSRYFKELHAGAEFVAEHHASFRRREDLAGETALLLYPVREHYLVYEPLGPRFVAIVAVVRQGRDVPSVLRKWARPIRQELTEIRRQIQQGTLVLPAPGASKRARRKK